MAYAFVTVAGAVPFIASIVISLEAEAKIMMRSLEFFQWAMYVLMALALGDLFEAPSKTLASAFQIATGPVFRYRLQGHSEQQHQAAVPFDIHHLVRRVPG